MPRVAVVQLEAYRCPVSTPRGYDIVVYPVTLCPPPHADEKTTLIMPRGGYIEVFDGGSIAAYPCGSVLEVRGVRLLILCNIDPCTPCNSADAVLVATLWWSGRGEAMREARRLSNLLMTISYRCGAPVLFANLSGAYGGRVFTGRSGIYDYELGAPLTLAGIGEGWISHRIG